MREIEFKFKVKIPFIKSKGYNIWTSELKRTLSSLKAVGKASKTHLEFIQFCEYAHREIDDLYDRYVKFEGNNKL